MAQITAKELTAIEDMLAIEHNLVAKYYEYASKTEDPALKSKFEQTALRHQRHYDELYYNLK